jgi:hypothetical protein
MKKTRTNQIHKSFLLLIFLQFAVMETVLAQSSTENDKPDFLGRGVIFGGFSGGASVRESENENALIVTIDEQSKTGYNLLFAGGYMLKPRFAVGFGLRADQSRLTKTTVDSDGIMADVQEAGSIFTSSVFIKNFIPLTANQRINLYNLVGIAYIDDRNNSESFSQDILTRTYTHQTSVRLGISPGIQVFIVEGFATEVGVNVAGLSGTRKVVSVNGVEDSSVETFDLDLRLNILSLSISFYYYFPTRKKS